MKENLLQALCHKQDLQTLYLLTLVLRLFTTHMMMAGHPLHPTPGFGPWQSLCLQEAHCHPMVLVAVGKQMCHWTTAPTQPLWNMGLLISSSAL